MNAVATPVSAPAGRSSLGAWFARTRASVWHAMELAAWARAQAHLMQFADRCEHTQPELAKELRSAAHCGPLL